MKTPKPKVAKPAVKDKLTTPKSGKIQKSLGNAPAKKLSAISSLKSADQALKIIKENEGNVELKVKNKKKKGGSPGNVASPQGGKGSPKVHTSQVNPGQKGDKKKAKRDVANQEKVSPVNGVGPTNKKLKKVMNDVENNTSPVKVATDSKKKVKVPLKIDAPVMTPTKKGQRPETGNKSPEVILGLQLEKALSPKSKNKKKNKLLKDKLQTEGKVEVMKKKAKAPAKPASTVEDGEGGKKKRKRRRRRKGKKAADIPIADLSMFDEINATNAVKALLKTSKAAKSEKKELFTEDKFVYLQCNLLKGSEATKSVLHMVLPHSILPESPEICLITPDVKGKRNDPDEAIDFYKDLLRNKGIDYVSEILPIRKLKKEYGAFEQRRAMANRFDAVLVDGKINKFARIGRRFAPTKKCVCAVKLDANDLKVEFDKALRKVAMFSNGKGLSFSIKCGREGMPVNQIADNIIAIGKYLACDKIVIGNIKNVGSVYVKTALSSSFPVYVSTVSPNDVPYPEGKKRKVEEPVEDEVTTVMDGTVVVHPTGNVRVKKQFKGAVGFEDFKTHEEPSVHKKSKMKEDKKSLEGKKLVATGFTSDEDKYEDDSEVDIDFDNLPSDFEVDDSDMGEEGSDFEDNSEVDSEIGVEEDSEVGEEVSEGESGEESDEDEEEDDEATDDADEDSDSAEGEIADAEMQYLQEVRKMQDGFAKKKKALGAKMPEKEKPKGKPAQQQAAPQKPEGKAKPGKKAPASVEVAQKKGGKGAAMQKGVEKKPAGAKGSPANENKFQKNKQQNQNRPESRQGNQQSPKNKFESKKKFGNKEANKGAIGKNNTQPQKPMNQQKNFEKKGNQKFNKGSPGGPDKGKFEKKKNAGEAKFSVKKPLGGKKFNK